jgi:hypothetical protein
MDTRISAETVDSLHSKVILYDVVKQLAYSVLEGLVECEHPVPPTLLQEIFDRIQPTKPLDLRESTLLPFVRQTLYTRNREAALELRKQ